MTRARSSRHALSTRDHRGERILDLAVGGKTVDRMLGEQLFASGIHVEHTASARHESSRDGGSESRLQPLHQPGGLR